MMPNSDLTILHKVGKLYDEIKKQIIQHMPTYGVDAVETKIEKMFIDDFNKAIVAVVAESIATEDDRMVSVPAYSYGIYSVYDEACIPVNSMEYRQITVAMPPPCIPSVPGMNFMELRAIENREMEYIERYAIEKKLDDGYIELLRQQRSYAREENTFGLYGYFIRDYAKFDNLDEKKELLCLHENEDGGNEISEVSDIMETVSSGTTVIISPHMDMADSSIQSQKNKESGHSLIIFAIASIAAALGILSAFLLVF